ncbi:HIT family protein [Candidatus Woesearchaeota archaeon]|nr:HIT family protein [Candidatus Woesearchaeota archaeon]
MNEKLDDCSYCDIPTSGKPLIKNYENWTLLLNFKQPTLGSVVLSLNRHIENLSDLEKQEQEEYFVAVNELEYALRESFQPDMINHMMLANKVRHLHYHNVPRYETPREFAGQTWVDETYGKMPVLAKDVKNDALLETIANEIIYSINNKR